MLPLPSSMTTGERSDRPDTVIGFGGAGKYGRSPIRKYIASTEHRLSGVERKGGGLVLIWHSKSHSVMAGSVGMP